MDRKPVVTIDGPAGAGKSTVSKLIARRFSFFYLDTGALYRALAYQLDQLHAEKTQEAAISISARAKVGLSNEHGVFHVSVDGRDVTDLIRTERIGWLASEISAIPAVRENLLEIQRRIGAAGGVVAEGRDMGTVVFPDAEIKIYLDASVEERAKRRYEELLTKNVKISLEKVKGDIIARDQQDSNRAAAPLRIPKDAVVIDSTDKTVDEIVDTVSAAIERLLHVD